MKRRYLTGALSLVVGITCGIGLSDAFGQTQKSPPPTTIHESVESGRERLAQAQQASLTPAERLAWREIQERIDR